MNIEYRKLEEEYNEAQESLGLKGLENISNEEMSVLLAYEMWKDGADWEIVEELKVYYREHRDEALEQLIKTYGYGIQ